MGVTTIVQCKGRNYVTNSVGGQRARSTISACMAAARLGKKLLHKDFAGVQRIFDLDLPEHATRWEILSKGGAT
ncbi:hypothetical protein CK625_12495 [Vandammella animalimorsus]|uniref:Uncharacterized protein n=1 Tax=Vandammella animalimorsus TaxID=2029117 RepID=A0A2A2AAV6_9BURK|nr:hypothetical protein CK625_12495 [Vandammella animalimorsus]